MKKFLCTVLASMMMVSMLFTGCGKSSIAGVYKVTSMTEDGEDYTELLSAMGMTIYLDLEDDGTGTINMYGETMDVEWDDDEITIDGESQEYDYSKGTITMEEDGTSLVFEKLTKDELEEYESNN